MKIEEYNFFSRLLPKNSEWECSQDEFGKILLKKEPYCIEFIKIDFADITFKWLIGTFDLKISNSKRSGVQYDSYNIWPDNWDSVFVTDELSPDFIVRRKVSDIMSEIAKDLGPHFYIGKKERIYAKAQPR